MTGNMSDLMSYFLLCVFALFRVPIQLTTETKRRIAAWTPASAGVTTYSGYLRQFSTFLAMPS
jgi:hypothetical protein